MIIYLMIGAIITTFSLIAAKNDIETLIEKGEANNMEVTIGVIVCILFWPIALSSVIDKKFKS